MDGAAASPPGAVSRLTTLGRPNNVRVDQRRPTQMISREKPARKSARHKRFERAIAALFKAYDALAAITDGTESRDDSRLRLKADINEYASYLDRVTWWRDADHPKED